MEGQVNAGWSFVCEGVGNRLTTSGRLLRGVGVWTGGAWLRDAEVASRIESACEIVRTARIATMIAAATTDKAVVQRSRVRFPEVLILWRALFNGDICKDSPDLELVSAWRFFGVRWQAQARHRFGSQLATLCTMITGIEDQLQILLH